MPHWNSDIYKVEGTETRSDKVIRKDMDPVIIEERKGLQNWKGVVECLVQLRIFQPVGDGDIVYTIVMLECKKRFLLG